MRRPLRLLTTDRVPAYIRSLSRLNARLDVLVARDQGLGHWFVRLPELPDGARPVTAERAALGLMKGAYDAAIAHDPIDLLAFGGGPVPTVLVQHEPRPLAELTGDGPSSWTPELRRLVDASRVIYPSAGIASTWVDDGAVVPPGLDPADFPLGDGSVARALSVVPFAAERGALGTARLLADLSAGLPMTVLGLNPGLGVLHDTATRAARRQACATHRLYVNCAIAPFEPAAPSAMLEAMAAGMPVVTLAHADSPVADGVNGFVCHTVHDMRARVLELLDDAALALRMGSEARRTILTRYSPDAFAEAWARVLDARAARAA